MKRINLFYVISLLLITSSCVSSSYYQVYSVKPLAGVTNNNTEELLYEDTNCKIIYSFWGNGGNVRFDFYNKTDKPIRLKLKDCFFIMNGYAYDYFKNRTYTSSETKSRTIGNSKGSSVAVTGVNLYNYIQTNKSDNSASNELGASIGYSLSYKEDSIIVIPSKSKKRIDEHSITGSPIGDCDLVRYPKTKKVKKLSYSLSNSPLVFSNRIVYEIDNKSKFIENDFFVEEITNLRQQEFYSTSYKEICGKRMDYLIKNERLRAKNKFYLIYQNGTKEIFHSSDNSNQNVIKTKTNNTPKPIIVKSELTDKDTSEYTLYNTLNPSTLKRRDMVVFQIGNIFYKGTVIMKSGNLAINVSVNKISQKRNNQWVESPPKETYTVDKKQILYIKRTL